MAQNTDTQKILQAVMQLVSQLSTAVNVSSINPNLGILPGAVPQSQYIQQMISGIASPIIGQMPGSLLGSTIGSLYQSRGNHLPILNQSYVNRLNMSAAGFVYQSQAAQQAAAYEDAKQKYAKAALQGKQDAGTSAISGWRSLFRLSENDAGKTADNIGAVAKILADQDYKNSVNSNTDKSTEDLIIQGAITASGLAATSKRGEFGGFSSVQVSQIAKQLAGRNMLTSDNISNTVGNIEQRYNVLANMDPDKQKELKSMDTLAKKTSMYLKDMAKAIQPLKDIFGNDIPSLYSSLEQLTGININGMSAQGISNLASGIRNTLTVTDASLTDVARYQSGIQQLSDSYGIRMRPADKLNQALQFTRMAHNLQSSGYMTDAQMRQQLGTLTVGTANSEHADNYSKAYGMWVAADQTRRKLTQKQRRQQFRQAYDNLIKSGMSADAAFAKLGGQNSVHGLRNTTYSHQARTDAAVSARRQHITEQTNWAVQNQLLALSADDQKTVLKDLANKDIDRDKLVGQIFQAYGNSDKLQGIRQNYGISQTTLDFLMRVGQNTTSDGRTIGAMNHAHNNDVKMRDRQTKIDRLAQRYQSTSQDLLYNIIRGGKIQDEGKALFKTQLDKVRGVEQGENNLGGRKLLGPEFIYFNALSDEHQKKVLQRAQRQNISIIQATDEQLNVDKLEAAKNSIAALGLDNDAAKKLADDLSISNKLVGDDDRLLDTKDLQALNKGLAKQQYIGKINEALGKVTDANNANFTKEQKAAIENLAKAQKNAKAMGKSFDRAAWLEQNKANNVLTNDVLVKWDSIKQQQGIGTTMGQDIKGVLSTLVDIYRFLTRN